MLLTRVALLAIVLQGVGGVETAQASPQKLTVHGLAAQRQAAPAMQRGGLQSLLTGGAANALDYGPTQVRSGLGSTIWIRMVATAAESSPLLGPGRFALVLSVFVESTQTEEFFALQVPSTPPGQRRPLLTCFHGFGSSYQDVIQFTTFLDEAAQRDWFVIAPLQISTAGNNPQNSFASVQSQEHVEAVIAFVMQNYSVDRDRLYGVGFSMGGGNVMSYAARHRDRASGAFAAVINHTGTVALSDVYVNVSATAQAEMDVIFHGSPAERPFAYLRSSMIEVDGAGAFIPGGSHMGRNLVNVAIRNVYGIGDPQQYLVDQTIEFDRYLLTLPGSQHELIGVPVNPACAHCWETLDEADACDWLGTHTLNPSSMAGGYLVDRTGDRWGPFDIDTEVQDLFGTLRYAVDLPNNRITLHETSNTAAISFDVTECGLNPLLRLEVQTGTSDGTGDRIILRGMNAEPNSVQRNGVTVLLDCAGSSTIPTWCYDPFLGTVELNVTDSIPADWIVIP